MVGLKRHPELAEFFRDADYIDVKHIDAETTLRVFIAGMLSYYPWWLVALYRIREILVSLLGLVKHDKPESLPSFSPEDISFAPEDNVSFFIVRKAKEDAFWLSETPPDRHLTAYFGVVTEKQSSGLKRFEVVTAVRYLHWTGPVYFNLIRPFHHLVVSRMMRAGAASN
jgi:hypothetical protein